MAALDRDGADVASWLALACVHGPRQPAGRAAQAAMRDTGGMLQAVARA
jgi:hypothetical protein